MNTHLSLAKGLQHLRVPRLEQSPDLGERAPRKLRLMRQHLAGNRLPGLPANLSNPLIVHLIAGSLVRAFETMAGNLTPELCECWD